MLSGFVRLGLMYLVKKMVDNAIALIKEKAKEILGIINTINGAYVTKLQEAWEGEAANAFLQKIETRLNKEINDLIDTVLQLPKGLDDGRNCIESADDQATQEVGKLTEIFQSIYP